MPPNGVPLTGASNTECIEKSQFSANISLYLGTDIRESGATVTIECE